MAPRKSKFVGPLFLSADEYARLEQLALAEERDPLQHARWLIKQALRDTTTDDALISGAVEPIVRGVRHYSTEERERAYQCLEPYSAMSITVPFPKDEDSASG